MADASPTSVADMAVSMVLGGAALLAMASVRASDIGSRCRACVDELRKLESRELIGTDPSSRISCLAHQVQAFYYRYNNISISCLLFALSIFFSFLYAAHYKLTTTPDQPDTSIHIGNVSSIIINIDPALMLQWSTWCMFFGLVSITLEFWWGHITLDLNRQSVMNHIKGKTRGRWWI
jgi:hypothetical protein